MNYMLFDFYFIILAEPIYQVSVTKEYPEAIIILMQAKMASIIPDYKYDIFISYRQKDNKYDGWVTEFVDCLKRELEATFKEEVTVYFDINPNDGLLETHDVNASLKEKLKCLVFIPIISRTY